MATGVDEMLNQHNPLIDMTNAKLTAANRLPHCLWLDINNTGVFFGCCC